MLDDLGLTELVTSIDGVSALAAKHAHLTGRGRMAGIAQSSNAMALA